MTPESALLILNDHGGEILHTCRNPPINRLPPDTVSQIVQCFLHDADCCIDPGLPVLAQLHHVKPHQQYWTRISNLSKGLTTLILERAEAAPLQESPVGEDSTTCCVPAFIYQKRWHTKGWYCNFAFTRRIKMGKESPVTPMSYPQGSNPSRWNAQNGYL